MWRSGSAQLAARAIAAALSLAVLSCTEAPPPPAVDAGGSARRPPGASDGQLTEVEGAVTLERAGQASAAKPGPLFQDDALSTGADGRAVVTLPGGRVVELGPEARFILTSDAQGLVLNVARGLILSRVPADAAAGPQVTLRIQTPFGLTRVGQSEVSLDVGDDGAKVDVKVGSIELVSRNGQAVTVAAGEAQVLSRTGATPWVMPAVPIVIASVSGKAEVRKRDQTKWALVSGARPTPLESGDAVRVRDGRAVLEGGSGRLVASKGAEVIVVQSAPGRTAVTLNKGGLAASFAPGKRSVLALGEVSLVSEQGGQVELEKTERGYSLSALAGDVVVQRDGQRDERVEGGQVAEITDTVRATDAGREPFALPARPGLKVFHPGLLRVALTWDGADGKAYRVEVAQDPSFTAPLLSGVVHQRFVNVAAPQKGNLYWRVFDGAAQVDQGSAYFAPEPRAGGELDRNKNEVKDGAEKTTIYFQDKTPVVTFSWAEEPGAARYRVQVFKEGELKKPVLERQVKELKVVVPEGTLDEGRYVWGVTPLDAKDASLKGGKLNKLEISYDNAVPALTLKSPVNGQAVGAQAKVVGIAPVGSKVFCNGRAVPLDDKARFDVAVPSLAGGRLICKMVKGAAEVYTVRRIR
ncbi:MAG: FecR domain-containing protein [Myxococcaceae bacterium]|nr:FecR domain-containing protein [Myxococcaceae bacterium]